MVNYYDEVQYLTREEKGRIRNICDLTKFYFMERYLLSLTDFPGQLVATMVNDMDSYYTDKNTRTLNKSYINKLLKMGYGKEDLKDAELIVSRTSFENFSRDLYRNLCMIAEAGQDIVINSDTNKLFAELGLVNDYYHTVLDFCLSTNGIPNHSSILDCCRINVSRDRNGELQTSAKRIIFPVEKDDETAEDVSEMIHKQVKENGTLKFIDIPLEGCYGKYLESDGMETN